MQFSRKGDLIKTKFDDYSSGLYGEIVAGEVEVMSVEVEPAKEPPAGERVTGFSMR